MHQNEQHVMNLLSTVKPMNTYKNVFEQHCKEFPARISTGLLELDKALNGGLANELYIMGAETSTGKSAFLMSIAQKIAESGIDVLYFALEMGTDEFVARGISSISFQQNRIDQKNRKIKASDVLYWTFDNTLNAFSKMRYNMYSNYAEEYFNRYGEHLHIVESGLSGLTVKDIGNMAATFKQMHGNKTIAVFVDYLQIIKADPSDRTQTDRKSKTDTVVTTLKTLASQIGMPVVTISSVSRSNYNGKISTSSFKESGDTEYTGGILLGWNWDGVTNETDSSKRDIEKEICKKRGYRNMTLDILKYRNSERDRSIHLKYYPAYNFFEENDGWNSLEDETNPFNKKKIIRA